MCIRDRSKRIPRKNIKEFCGQAMIGYSIEAAITSQCFDKVIVSTDDQEIAEVAKSFGAEVPFIRPDELANDHAATIPVVKHAIEWFDEQGQLPTDVCCLYATAPFIQSQTISKAFQQLQESEADYCFSVTSFAFPIQRSIRITQDGKVDMFYPENFNVRSQDLEEAYHDAGQFYWGKAQVFKDELPIFSETASPYILPRYLVQDIDTMEDWIRAEAMHRVLKETDLFP